MYPRRIRVYYGYSPESTPLPPAYITISRNAPLSSLVSQLQLDSSQDITSSNEFYRVDFGRKARPWGDLTPLSIEEFCDLTGEKQIILGLNPTEEELQNTIGGAPLDLQDSLIVINASKLHESRELPLRKKKKVSTKPIGSLGLYNLYVLLGVFKRLSSGC